MNLLTKNLKLKKILQTKTNIIKFISFTNQVKSAQLINKNLENEIKSISQLPNSKINSYSKQKITEKEMILKYKRILLNNFILKDNYPDSFYNDSYIIDLKLEEYIQNNDDIELENDLMLFLIEKTIYNIDSSVVLMNNTINALLKKFLIRSQDKDYIIKSVTPISILIYKHYSQSITIKNTYHLFISVLVYIYNDVYFKEEINSKLSFSEKIKILALFIKVGYKIDKPCLQFLIEKENFHNITSEANINTNLHIINNIFQIIAYSDMSIKEKEEFYDIYSSIVLNINIGSLETKSISNKITFLLTSFYMSISQYNNKDFWVKYFKMFDKYISLCNLINQKKIFQEQYHLNNHDLSQSLSFLLILKIIDNSGFYNKYYEKYNSKLKALYEIESKNNDNRMIRRHNNLNIHKLGRNEALFKDILFNYYKEKIKFQVLIDNLLDVDIIYDDKVVININGPSHYSIFNNMNLNLKSKIKNMMIESLGYMVIDINIYEISKKLKNIMNEDYLISLFEEKINQVLDENKKKNKNRNKK